MVHFLLVSVQATFHLCEASFGLRTIVRTVWLLLIRRGTGSISVSVGRRPSALTYGGGFLWVGSSSGELHQIDTTTFEIRRTYTLRGASVVDIEVTDTTVWAATDGGGWWLEWFDFQSGM